MRQLQLTVTCWSVTWFFHLFFGLQGHRQPLDTSWDVLLIPVVVFVVGVDKNRSIPTGQVQQVFLFSSCHLLSSLRKGILLKGIYRGPLVNTTYSSVTNTLVIRLGLMDDYRRSLISDRERERVCVCVCVCV